MPRVAMAALAAIALAAGGAKADRQAGEAAWTQVGCQSFDAIELVANALRRDGALHGSMMMQDMIRSGLCFASARPIAITLSKRLDVFEDPDGEIFAIWRARAGARDLFVMAEVKAPAL